MGYRFSGFFIDQSNPEIIESIQTRWLLIKARPIYSPFSGYGFAFPDHVRCTSDEGAELISEEVFTVFKELPALSTAHPNITFVWIEADCAGGTCLYSGYGCINGEVIVNEEKSSSGALGKLLQILNVKLGTDNYFLPFTRNFFWK